MNVVMLNAQKWSILETLMWCHNFINMCSKPIIFLPRLVIYDCHLIMYFYEKKNYNISSHCLKTGSKHFFSLFLIHKRVLIIAHFAVDMGGGCISRVYHIHTYLFIAHTCLCTCMYLCVSWPWNWEMANILLTIKSKVD